MFVPNMLRIISKNKYTVYKAAEDQMFIHINHLLTLEHFTFHWLLSLNSEGLDSEIKVDVNLIYWHDKNKI